MSRERTHILHQEKIILIAVGVLILVAIATLVFRQHQATQNTETKIPRIAPVSVTFEQQPDAKKVIVYTDPMCDRCAAYHEDVVKPLYDDYVKKGKVTLEIRPLGIVSQDSADLNELTMCAHEQKSFFKTVEYLNEKIHAGKDAASVAGNFFTTHDTPDIARSLKLDEKQLRACLDEDGYDKKLSQADSQAYAAGIYSAPTTVIGSHEPVRGYATYAYIRSLIDATN